MSAYKQFLSSDIIITPFLVNKDFIYYGGNELTASNVCIDRFLGTNIPGLFNSSSNITTGYIQTEYQNLIYHSVKELYYSNYLSSSYGDIVTTASLIPGSDREGDRFIGPVDSAQYWNYLQTNLTYPKYFPTESGRVIGVISIPSKLFGEYIQPGSFRLIVDSGSLTDDGEGNLLDEANSIVGNIFYPHGIIVIMTEFAGTNNGPRYASAVYATDRYGFYPPTASIENAIYTDNITCSFSSSLTIYETQYKCTIRENEFNLSLNPSMLTSGSEDTYLGIVTSSYFTPYITTVGLYNEKQELLMVGKLAQPLNSSDTTDTSIIISLDRW